MPKDIVTADKLQAAQKLNEIRSGIGVKGTAIVLYASDVQDFSAFGFVSVSMKAIKLTVLSSFGYLI